MQAPSSTDRLACAIFTGEKAIHRAVRLLANAGFAAESISVIWRQDPEPDDDEADDDDDADADADDDERTDDSAGAPPDHQHAVLPLVAPGAGQPAEAADDEPDDLDEAPVVIRTGVRRFLPAGAVLGALGGILLVWFDGDPTAPFVPQIITAVTTGGFLGAMGGIVMGLGQWEHFVELPETKRADRPLLIAVDVAAQGREPEARAALGEAGAALVKVCTRQEAEQFVREASVNAA